MSVPCRLQRSERVCVGMQHSREDFNMNMGIGSGKTQ